MAKYLPFILITLLIFVTSFSAYVIDSNTDIEEDIEIFSSARANDAFKNVNQQKQKKRKSKKARVEDLDEEEIDEAVIKNKISQEIKKLEKLACRKPKKVHVSVTSALGGQESDNPLKFASFWPSHVVVRRCLEECGFCRIGQICTASKVKEKKVFVSYFEGRSFNYTNIKVKEHRRCKCKMYDGDNGI